MARPKAAVVYFSRPGENLYGGTCQFLNQGNTLLVARQIAVSLQRPLVALQPVRAYETAYKTVLQRTQQELQQQQLPALKPLPQSLGQVTQLYLGFPVWWGHLPRPVVTFLKQQYALQVTLTPFCTHEGSHFGSTISELKQLVPAAELQPGLAIRGTNAWCAQRAIQHWLKK